MSRKTNASTIAFGGVMAALAVVIMCLGGVIPVATFVCPMLCMLVMTLVQKRCGSSIGWAWYGAVAILSLLLSPDKEGAAVFVVLGYYPILKPKMDKLPISWLWKGLLFNAAILSMYAALIHAFGMAQLMEEFEEMGTTLTAVTLVLGNVTFYLLDALLGRKFNKKTKKSAA